MALVHMSSYMGEKKRNLASMAIGAASFRGMGWDGDILTLRHVGNFEQIVKFGDHVMRPLLALLAATSACWHAVIQPGVTLFYPPTVGNLLHPELPNRGASNVGGCS